MANRAFQEPRGHFGEDEQAEIKGGNGGADQGDSGEIGAEAEEKRARG